MTTAAIIVAAGSGSRVGGEIPKQYHNLGGQPVLRMTTLAFARHPAVDRIQLVIGEGHEPLCRQALDGLDLPPPVLGGTTRQASAHNGLESCVKLPKYAAAIPHRPTPAPSGCS